MALWKKMALLPLSQKGNWVSLIERIPKKFKIFPTLTTTCYKKKLAPTKKYFWVWGVYTMENKDTNTDYQKVVRVRDQKSEIKKITTRIIFCI